MSSMLRKVPDRELGGWRGMADDLRELLLVRSYLARPLSSLAFEGVSRRMRAPEAIDIATVAFNTPYVIEEQIRLLRKYLRDPFDYTVIDNSTDRGARAKIREICRRERVGYVPLPENPYLATSAHHGLALTWAYRHLLSGRGAWYFGTLDHDIFPTREIRLRPQLDLASAHGHARERGERWYLWPGLAFFRRDGISGVSFDWRPAEGVDTGGRLWGSLYRNLPREKVAVEGPRYKQLRAGDNPQEDMVEYLGDWVHLINASNWAKGRDKTALAQKFLREL
jgi:hypothetical protein